MKYNLKACLLWVIIGCSNSFIAQAADLVMYNARIYTLNSQHPWADTIAISGDRIVYVGNRQGVEKFIDDDTVQNNLLGKLVLPGFIDAHMHVGDTFPFVFAATLNPDMTADEVLQTITLHAAKYPHQNPLVGRGFLGAVFGEQGPTARQLDKAVPDRPAIMFDEGGHTAWINTAAMNKVGLNRESVDPVPGSHYFKRYQDGTPTGWLIEGGAFEDITGQLGVVTEQNLAKGAESFLKTMSSMGITAAFDAGMGDGGEKVFSLLDKLATSGELPVRIVGSYYVNTPKQIPSAVTTVKNLHARYHSEMFDIRVLKLSLDGTVEAQTAFTIEPYKKPEGHRAQLLIPAAPSTEAVLNAARANIDVHLHTLGDGAVRLGLDMVEKVRQEVPESTSRFTLCHLEIVNPLDVPRFGKLDVIAQSTPSWFVYDDIALEYLGEERFEHMYPIKSMAAGGAKLTLGSDYPASWIGLDGLNPLFNIEMAITRQPAGDKNYVIQAPATERISLEQAIRGYTLDAAYQLRLEDQIGSLEVGKQADLVVLSNNIFEMDTYDIHTVGISLTMVNGKVVYQTD